MGTGCRPSTFHEQLEVVMSAPIPPKRKRLLCRFNLHHKWVRRFDPDGSEDYMQCTACGKYNSYYPAGRMM
jgi:hypothetical protein